MSPGSPSGHLDTNDETAIATPITVTAFTTSGFLE